MSSFLIKKMMLILIFFWPFCYSGLLTASDVRGLFLRKDVGSRPRKQKVPTKSEKQMRSPASEEDSFDRQGREGPEHREKNMRSSVMESVKDQLINAVPAAVAMYGVAGVSTRNIADMAGVSDGNIYRFFNGRDDLIYQAYVESSERFFNMVIRYIDELRDNDQGLHLKDCARIIFKNIWRFLLDDPDICRFHTDYYYSRYFEKYALEYHEGRIKEVAEHLMWLFWTESDAVRCMRYIFTLVYDAAKQVTDGRLSDDEETMNIIFEDMFNMLFTSSNRWPFRAANM